MKTNINDNYIKWYKSFLLHLDDDRIDISDVFAIELKNMRSAAVELKTGSFGRCSLLCQMALWKFPLLAFDRYENLREGKSTTMFHLAQITSNISWFEQRTSVSRRLRTSPLHQCQHSFCLRSLLKPYMKLHDLNYSNHGCSSYGVSFQRNALADNHFCIAP